MKVTYRLGLDANVNDDECEASQEGRRGGNESDRAGNIAAGDIIRKHRARQVETSMKSELGVKAF